MAKIIGNTTATPGLQSDWNQNDETKADYIKNKPTSAVPTIRFVNACFANGTSASRVVSPESPLQLTVEVIGSGSLKVGDTLQACTRQTYWYKQRDKDGNVVSVRKKQKLRRFAEYSITKNDIGKRFLTLTLTAANKAEQHALFHSNSMNSCDNLSPIYLRIRRPKGELQSNNSGMTIDAEFSNIIAIWKRYSQIGQIITIK